MMRFLSIIAFGWLVIWSAYQLDVPQAVVETTYSLAAAQDMLLGHITSDDVDAQRGLATATMYVHLLLAVVAIYIFTRQPKRRLLALTAYGCMVAGAMMFAHYYLSMAQEDSEPWYYATLALTPIMWMLVSGVLLFILMRLTRRPTAVQQSAENTQPIGVVETSTQAHG